MSSRTRILAAAAVVIAILAVIGLIVYLRTRMVEGDIRQPPPVASSNGVATTTAEIPVVSPPDQDGDGLRDESEVTLGTDPAKADTDGDGISDYAEINVFNTDPLSKESVPAPRQAPQGNTELDDPVSNELRGGPPASTTPQPTETSPPAASPDPDNDGLTTIQEEQIGTDPNKADTDGDGFNDGEEVNAGYNPLGPGRR
ncbi:thrombospondin type 3 repeat-containing protein [Patescibacteria group bacterium]|jgi:hypothetical protein|nr:thrombospondin type 3 repeat-containing protein [Patescibacteria group bacterium]